eukprot:scaffold1399_cov410-Prasinococcus_capsulatus_cf.AAC.17
MYFPAGEGTFSLARAVRLSSVGAPPRQNAEEDGARRRRVDGGRVWPRAAAEAPPRMCLRPVLTSQRPPGKCGARDTVSM